MRSLPYFWLNELDDRGSKSDMYSSECKKECGYLLIIQFSLLHTHCDYYSMKSFISLLCFATFRFFRFVFGVLIKKDIFSNKMRTHFLRRR